MGIRAIIVQFQAGARCFSFARRSDNLGTHPSSLVMGTVDAFHGSKVAVAMQMTSI